MDGELVEFCRRMRPRLVGSLHLLTNDAFVAEDLAQETLARVWDRWDEVAAMAAPEAWTYRVATNLAYSRFRRRSARRHREARDAHAEPPAGGELSVAAAIVVREAVARLPRRQRTAVVLRFYDDLSVADTAEVMECAPGTVKALTHQAVTRLRAHGQMRDLLSDSERPSHER